MLFKDVAIRGAWFRGADVMSLVNSLEPGRLLSFEREPDNAYDGMAVKALVEDIHIGYVAKEIAGWLAPHMDSGHEFIGIVTSMQAGRKGNLEPWVSIGDEPSIQYILLQIKEGTYSTVSADDGSAE